MQRFWMTVLGSIAALSGASAHAATLLGVNSVDNGGGLYLIDTATGGTTFFAPTPLPGGGTFGPNCLAWDATNFRAYYTSLGLGGDHLYRYNATDGTTADLGEIDAAANGSFYNGRYYTITSNGRLLEVRFDAGGNVSDTRLFSIRDGRAWGFGDIAITKDGVLYGSGTDFSTSLTDLFTIDLSVIPDDGPSLTVLEASYILDGKSELLQLAFAGDDLFGMRTNTGEIFQVDTGTGALTFLSQAPAGFAINDLASVPAPGAALTLGLSGLIAARRRR